MKLEDGASAPAPEPAATDGMVEGPSVDAATMKICGVKAPLTFSAAPSTIRSVKVKWFDGVNGEIVFNNRYTIPGHPDFLCGLIDTRKNTRPLEPCDHGRRYLPRKVRWCAFRRVL